MKTLIPTFKGHSGIKLNHITFEIDCVSIIATQQDHIIVPYLVENDFNMTFCYQ